MAEYAMNGQVVTGIWKRYLGWITVSLLVAFLINNFLNIYFGFKGFLSLFTGFSVTGSATLLIYIVFTVIGVWYVNRTIHESYRNQAKKLHDFNVVKSFRMYQDTLFNILLSFKSYNIFKFIYIVTISLVNIIVEKNRSSSLLYICKKI